MLPIKVNTQMRYIFILIVCFFITPNIHAQQPTIALTLKDSTEAIIPNAFVFIKQKRIKLDTGVQHLITLDSAGTYTIKITATNHYSVTQTLTILQDTSLTIYLPQRISLLGAITVRSSRNINRNQMGVQSIGIDMLRKLPVILGEIDPLKTITLLPGIKSGGEASAGIYVRGGGPDQNLILLDGINIYNPNHLLGFFSVFNGEAIKDIEVIKSGFPAEYGGRLSSVININTREGDKTQYKGSGGIGLISTRLSVEGPIAKNKASFIVSARRTYIDQVAKPFAKDRIGGNGYFFYDLNAKADWEINKKNQLSLTFYTGQDNFTFSNTDRGRNRVFNTNWGNTILGFNWDHQINAKLKHRTGLVYNKFGLDSRFGFSSLSFLFSSGLKDNQARTDWTYKSNKWLAFKWGANYTLHTFRPGAGGVTAGVQEFKTEIKNQYAREAALYVSADINVTPDLNIITGVRYSYFNQVGPTERTVYDADGFPLDSTVSFKRGESIAAYKYPEPRFSARYKITPLASIKFSYARTIQYLQLATTSGATFPSDLWIPSSQRVQPGKADQWSIGYFKNIKNGMYEFNVEAYYKTLTNQLEFKPGAQLLLNQNLEAEMIFGTGKAYGLELFFQKKQGKLTGWIGYTLSRAERKFADLNDGKTFPYRYDRTHDISVVANYPLSKKWELSGVFVYGTGNALTLPNGRFTYNLSYNGTTNQPIFTNINTYGAVNDYRMPAYHRMDISFVYTRRPDIIRRYKSSWNFSIYNIYNRANPFFIYLDANEDTQTIQGKKVYLFPIIPSVTWNVKL